MAGVMFNVKFDENMKRILKDDEYRNLEKVFPSNGEVASLEHEETAKIVKINLKQEYLKIQRKKVEGSQHRIQDAMVYFTVRSELVILNVQTYVQRFSDWIDDIMFNKPDNGWFELYTKMTKQERLENTYMADLDSVYTTLEGSNVYSLYKHKGNSARNIYVFFVQVELIDKTVETFAWPFLLKTKPADRKNR